MTSKASKPCPNCGKDVPVYQNPLPTVDIIIETDDGKVMLIHRKNEPKLWALPGGFVDYGESLEQAAMREAKEETGIDVISLKQFRAYSNPNRDKRFHTISMVFSGKAGANKKGKAADDADDLKLFDKNSLPELAFDHKQILEEWFSQKS